MVSSTDELVINGRKKLIRNNESYDSRDEITK